MSHHVVLCHVMSYQVMAHDSLPVRQDPLSLAVGLVGVRQTGGRLTPSMLRDVAFSRLVGNKVRQTKMIQWVRAYFFQKNDIKEGAS